MDINPRTAADVIHDLDDLPYPFDDDEFDEVVGRHVIEHVRDPLAVMSELHRITRAGGVVRLVVRERHYKHRNPSAQTLSGRANAALMN